MQRKIGACSWIFGGADDQTLAKVWQSAGLDGIEYNPTKEISRATRTRQIFDDYNLSVFSLTPPDADLSAPDAKIRNAALDTYYWLIDFACEVGSPIVSCHGLVGRIKPIASQQEENQHLLVTMEAIVKRAKEAGITIVFEVLNRYETHQIRTIKEALELITEINQPNFSVLLDSYHMNIEEPNPAEALRQADKHLGLFHMADSNREAPGRGHINFASQLEALDTIAYQGPIILEINAPGPNPFSPDKGLDFRKTVISYLAEGTSFLRNHTPEKPYKGEQAA